MAKLITKALILITTLLTFSATAFADPIMPWEKEMNNLRHEFTTEFRESVNDLAGHNINYLGITIGAIFGFITLLGFFFYFFSYKPLNEKLLVQEKEQKKTQGILNKQARDQKNQQNNLTEFKTKTEDSLKRMKGWMEQEVKRSKNEIRESKIELEDRIQGSEKESGKKANDILTRTEARIKISETVSQNKMNEIIEKAKEIELKIMWNENFIWKAQGVEANRLNAVINYIEKSIDYNRTRDFARTWGVSIIEESLDKLIAIKWNSHHKKEHEKLIQILSWVKEKDQIEKAKIIRIIEKSEKLLSLSRYKDKPLPLPTTD